MKKINHFLSLMLSFILLSGMAAPVHAEGSLADRIRKMINENQNVSEPTAEPQNVSQEENESQAEAQTPAAEADPQQNDAAGTPDDFADEPLNSRAAFSPDIMVAQAGTQVFSDSRLTAILGIIKQSGVVYAVSLSGNAVRIAFVSNARVIEGYVSPGFLRTLSDSDRASYQHVSSQGRKVYGQRLLPISFGAVSGAPSVIPTVQQTATPKATATPKPTATPKATATPKPTATPKVTAAPATATPASATAVPKGYPVILEQPKFLSSADSTFTVLTVKVSNALYYQWQSSTDQGRTWSDLTNGTIWIGNKKSTMYFNRLPRYDGYMFRCRVTSRIGYVYTEPVTLSIDGMAAPTAEPTAAPTVKPTATPTVKPTATPTVKPTAAPSAKPTATPAMSKPVFSVQPQSQTVPAGSAVTLAVSAANASSYQWQYSINQTAWVNLPQDGVWNGVQTEQLSFTALESYNGYSFRAVASNSAGAVLSNSARLTVTAPAEVSIVTQPRDVSAAAGTAVSFSVEAENADSYQWYYCAASSFSWQALTDGSVWSGSNTAVLSFTAGAFFDGGRFRCAVSGGGTSLTSDTAVFHFVGGVPVFDTSVNTVVQGVFGSTVTLTARVIGAASCQWQIKPDSGRWTGIPQSPDSVDLNNPSLMVPINSANLGFSFRVEAKNAYGTAYSPVYTLQESITGPTGVKAEPTGRNTIQVSWSASSSTKTRYYRVYWNTSDTVNYSQYVDATGTSLQLTGLNAGTTYHVWVQAVGYNKSSIIDNDVYASATTYAPAVKPAAPSSVAANASSTVMTVSWKKPSNSEVSGYYVYYAPASANAAQKVSVSGENTLSATLTELSRNTTYQIWVSAYNDAGEGNASARITATTLQTAAAPAQPTNVKAAAAAASSVKVTWTLSASADVAGYYVYYGTSSNVNGAARYSSALSAGTDNVTIGSLTAGTEYFFWVAAFNSDGAQSELNAGVRASATPKSVSTANKINAVDFSMMGDKYIGTPYAVYDCQAFVERMLADAGLSMNLAGSNAWYRTMSWRGTPEQCKATFGCIPTGAFLFIVAHDGGEPAHYNDNLGNANHIGVVIHRDLGAIHSSQRKGGVYYSLFQDATIPNGGWNMIGLWTRMDYGDEVNEKLEALVRKY